MKNNLFDKHFKSNNLFDVERHAEKTMKLAHRGITIVIIMWILWAIISLAAIGGLAYVAIHFLSKVW